MDNTLPKIAKALHSLDRREISAWLKRGELLTQAQALCSGDRDFASWLRDEGQAKTTAYKAMAAWANFGNVPTSERFSKVAMELLARCEGARDEAIAMARKTKVTATIARKLLDEHQPRTPAARQAIEARTRTIIGPGWKLTVRLESPGTTGDYLAALTQALTQIRDEMTTTRRAA
jgi:hypothetical protein